MLVGHCHWYILTLCATLLSLPSFAGVAPCHASLSALSALAWQQRFLSPEVPPLEPHFVQGEPLFYNLGREMSEGLSSTSFSNELPRKLVAHAILEDFRDREKLLLAGEPGPRLRDMGAMWQLEVQMSPIRVPLSLVNIALFFRNTVVFPIEAANAYTTAMETGPWTPRVLQFHKKPNFGFYRSYLPPDPNSLTLSPLGEVFASHMPGKTFLDLASGDPNRAVSHRAVAQRFGAKDYVGVDLNIVPWIRTKRGEFPQLSGDSGFTARYFKSDLLTFLRRLQNPGPMFIRIEGLQRYRRPEEGVEYLTKAMQEIQRVTLSGDILSVGSVTSFIKPRSLHSDTQDSELVDPSDYGFRLIERKGSREEQGGEFVWVKQ